MGILQSLSDAISWLREPLASAWAAAEPILCVLYLAAVLIISLWIWRQQGKGTRLLSTALFVLLAGEAYRLVPRIVEAISPRAPLPDGDGIGRIVSYLATAGFFLFLEFYRRIFLADYSRTVADGDGHADGPDVDAFGKG